MSKIQDKYMVFVSFFYIGYILMDFYDEIREKLDVIRDKDESKDEYDRLYSLFSEESGKEIYLIIAEWFSEQNKLKFESFLRISPLLRLLFDRLVKANKFVMNEFIQFLFSHCVSKTDEQLAKIYTVFTSPMMEEPTQPYIYFITAISSKLDPVLTEKLTLPEDKFSDLPEVMKIAISRAASLYPQNFRSFGLDRLCNILITNSRTSLREDGVILCSKITNPENSIKMFNSVLSVVPYLSTAEAAMGGWETCLKILHKMNVEERFHAIRLAFENHNIADTARVSLATELIKQIRNGQGTIFRSPNLIPVVAHICDPSILSSPITHVEVVISILTFLVFFLTFEKKYRCFMILGTPSENELQKSIELAKKGVAESEKQNNKPKEEILKNMKKSNFGENMTMDDVEKAVKATKISIARIKYSISEVEEILAK